MSTGYAGTHLDLNQVHMKILKHLILVLCLNVQVQAQRDTFPLSFDYSVGLKVTHDVDGFCECERTVARRDVGGYSWKRDSYMNCTYLDANKRLIKLEKVWVESEVPHGEWVRESKIRNGGGIKGQPLTQVKKAVLDTFQVFMTYETEDRKMVYDAPGECYCEGESVPTYSSNGQPGAMVFYEKCTWNDYSQGVLSDFIKMLAVEGLPYGQFNPD